MSIGSSNAGRVQHLSLTFVATLGLWLLLTASLDPQELIVGLLVALLATALSSERSPVFAGVRLDPGAPAGLLIYLAVFARALVLANLDMARRVLSPSIPLRPAVIRVKTRLQSDLGRLVLANSITLTPGTLTVDVIDDELLVHWVDCPPDIDMRVLSERVAGEFERHLGRFLR